MGLAVSEEGIKSSSEVIDSDDGGQLENAVGPASSCAQRQPIAKFKLAIAKCHIEGKKSKNITSEGVRVLIFCCFTPYLFRSQFRLLSDIWRWACDQFALLPPPPFLY